MFDREDLLIDVKTADRQEFKRKLFKGLKDVPVGQAMNIMMEIFLEGFFIYINSLGLKKPQAHSALRRTLKELQKLGTGIIDNAKVEEIDNKESKDNE